MSEFKPAKDQPQCRRTVGRKITEPISIGTKSISLQESELTRLRAELSQVKQELRYLKQATAHFVRILL
jgi:transposase-like protein